MGAAALYAHGGFPALVIAKTVVLLAAFAGAYRICRRRGAGPVASALALAAAAFVGRDRFVERPHVFSLAGEVAALAAIDALAERGGAAAARAAAWFLAGVVLWANLHAGVFVAPLLMGAAAVAALVAGDGAGARRLGLCAGGSALATLATPVGAGLLRYLRLHLTLPALHPVDEFRAPSWLSDAPLVVYGVLLVGGAAFLLGSGARRATGEALAIRRRALLALAPVLPLAALALHAVRFGADLALLAAPLLAVALTTAGARLAARAPAAIGGVLRSPLPAILTGALLIGFRRRAARRGRSGGSGHRARYARAAPRGDRLRERQRTARADVQRLRDRVLPAVRAGRGFSAPPGVRRSAPARLPGRRCMRCSGASISPATSGKRCWIGSASTALCSPTPGSIAVSPGGTRRAGRWCSGAATRGSSSGGCPRFASLIAAHEIPATFAFSVEEGTRRSRSSGVRPPRPSPSASGAGGWATCCSSSTARSASARGDAYERALAAPGGCLARADEARLGAWLGAVDLGAGHADTALALLERALGAREPGALDVHHRAAALEALGRRADAAAAWADLAGRAGDSPLAVRARARAAHLRN